jgi:hypothetical protein
MMKFSPISGRIELAKRLGLAFGNVRASLQKAVYCRDEMSPLQLKQTVTKA